MSELGSGSGSSYPGALDTDNTLEVNSPNAGKTKARAEVPNDLAAAIVAIETELGIDPAGSLSDVKTFLQTEHVADGTHGVITGTSLTVTGGVKTDGTNFIKTKVIDIGDWNMDATATVNVAHGLTFAKIRGAIATIRNDANDTYYLMSQGYMAAVSPPPYCSIETIDATNIKLSRVAGTIFDDAAFDATSFNRGWITITYVV